MVQINEGWEERLERVEEELHVFVDVAGCIYEMQSEGILTAEEVQRAHWKIALIRPFVTRMVLNMIKGTLKYPNDDWSTETWQDMGMDDKVDSVNYGLLFEDHLRKRGVI